jgi:hypothetical protein
VTSHDPSPDSDPLARQLTQHAQLLAQLRRDLDQLASETTHIHADLLTRFDDLRSDTPTAATSGTPTAWCWRNLHEESKEELWILLRNWVEWLRSRYPLAKRRPRCWAQHPEIVEELTALWLAWLAAYETENPHSPPPQTGRTAGCLDSCPDSSTAPLALPCRHKHEDRPTTASG